MILLIEIIILCIGIAVYFLQNKYRDGKKYIRNKIVYWTILLFISITYNSILFSAYSFAYDIENYFNEVLLINMAIALCIFFLIQILAPSKYIRFIKGLFMNKEQRQKDKELRKKEDEKNKLIREQHFEVFLETGCWLGFLFTIILEGYVYFLKDMVLTEFLGISLINAVCIIMMITIPVIVRQVVYYLMRIRDEKEDESISPLEKELQLKLKKQNNRL